MNHHVVAGGRLLRQLEAAAEEADCSIALVAEIAKPWSAATFNGGCHEFTFRVDGLSGRAWLDDLDEHSVVVPGYALVDLQVSTIETVDARMVATIEAMTIKEA